MAIPHSPDHLAPVLTVLDDMPQDPVEFQREIDVMRQRALRVRRRLDQNMSFVPKEVKEDKDC